MKKEYDFSAGQKGKFYSPDVHFNLPVYLEPDSQEFFEKLAKKKKMNYQELINNFVKANIQAYKTML